ncbi:hypothetical protein YC2023_050769 [Brassica napus]
MLQPRAWNLRFVNSPPPMIFTFSRIEAEDGSPIAIELLDAATNARVTSDLRLEIVALNADIAEESFTTEEFNRNILRPREGKPPLLAGDLTVTLEDGVGVVSGDVTFTENSSWTRCRLGAKVRQQGGVVEAITRAFVCRDRPGGECMCRLQSLNAYSVLKLIPKNEYYDKTLQLPKEFDATTAWSHSSSVYLEIKLTEEVARDKQSCFFFRKQVRLQETLTPKKSLILALQEAERNGNSIYIICLIRVEDSEDEDHTSQVGSYIST